MIVNKVIVRIIAPRSRLPSASLSALKKLYIRSVRSFGRSAFGVAIEKPPPAVYFNLIKDVALYLEIGVALRSIKGLAFQPRKKAFKKNLSSKKLYPVRLSQQSCDKYNSKLPKSQAFKEIFISGSLRSFLVPFRIFDTKSITRKYVYVKWLKEKYIKSPLSSYLFCLRGLSVALLRKV